MSNNDLNKIDYSIDIVIESMRLLKEGVLTVEEYIKIINTVRNEVKALNLNNSNSIEDVLKEILNK